MNTIRINFYLDIQRKNSEGLAPIQIRSKHNSDKLIIKATRLFCDPKQWPPPPPKPKPGQKRKQRDITTLYLSKDQHTANQQIELRQKLQKKYEELSIHRRGVTLNDVWEELYPRNKKYKTPISEKVCDWIAFYIENSPYSAQYLRGAKHLKVHLTGESKKGKVKAFNPELKFSDLNQTTIDGFCKHIVRQKKSTGTVVKIIKFLRQVSKMARDSGIKVGSIEFKAPRNYKKKVRTEVRLTFSEIMKLQVLPLEDIREQHVRDIFLFLCFSGMRHSDMLRITPADNHGDFVHFTQVKTDDQVAVTLHKYSKPILKKYSMDKETTERIFPVYTQQTFNKVIKDVARKAGLKDLVRISTYSGTVEEAEDKRKYKLIKSHTGRRSFSRILSLLSVPEEIISEEMGHNGVSITRHYIGNSEHVSRIKLVQRAWNDAEAILQPESIMKKAS